MSGQMVRNSLILIVATLTTTIGCTQTRRVSQPIAAAEPPGGRSPHPNGAVHLPRSVELFGDRPEHADLPFTNRLLTNFARHTFSNDGRDFDPDLSPEGDALVYASTRNAANPDVYIKRPKGTTLTQLTADPSDDIQPRFSPDGKKIVFCSNRAGTWDIWTINRDGTGLTQLTTDRADEIAPCWAPDGRRIAYCVWGRRSHQWEIWTLAVDEPGVKRFLCYGMFPAWSPDGGRIAFQRARQRGSRWFGVWTVRLVGEEARYPTEVAYSDTAACIAPRWSHDSHLLVYCAVKPENGRPGDGPPMRSDLWLVHPDSGRKYKLTDAGGASFNPVWDPEGRVYFVSAQAGVENIWSLHTDYALLLSALGIGSETPTAARVTTESTGTPGS